MADLQTRSSQEEKHFTIFEVQAVILYTEVTILYNKFAYFVKLYCNNFSPSSHESFTSRIYPPFPFFYLISSYSFKLPYVFLCPPPCPR